MVVYPVQEVLVGDQTGLSSQGDHARLNTHCLALSSVEVVCAPEAWTVKGEVRRNIQLRSILFSTGEPCKDRLILTARSEDRIDGFPQ